MSSDRTLQVFRSLVVLNPPDLGAPKYYFFQSCRNVSIKKEFMGYHLCVLFKKMNVSWAHARANVFALQPTCRTVDLKLLRINQSRHFSFLFFFLLISSKSFSYWYHKWCTKTLKVDFLHNPHVVWPQSRAIKLLNLTFYKLLNHNITHNRNCQAYSGNGL